MVDRRTEILQITADLIQTYGYKGFSYKNLSDRLGIAKASIHHHFPSKEDLGIAYCESKVDELEKFRKEMLNLKSASEKLKTYFEKPKARLATKKMCGINAMQSDSADMSENLKQAIREITELDINIVSEILAEGQISKEFNLPSSPEETSEVIVSALKGALQRSLLNNDNTYENVCHTLWNIISNNKKPA